MKCLIIDAVHSAIAEELSKYMQVDTHMLPTQEELGKLIPAALATFVVYSSCAWTPRSPRRSLTPPPT